MKENGGKGGTKSREQKGMLDIRREGGERGKKSREQRKNSFKPLITSLCL